MSKDAKVYTNYITIKTYGRMNNMKLNRNLFHEMLKSTSYLSQANAFRDTIILLDEHRKGNIDVSEYLHDLDCYTSEYYDVFMSNEVRYNKKNEINKGPNFHISYFVKTVYNSSPTRKLPRNIYYNSILSIYLISCIHSWEYVYHSLEEFKDSKEFSWDLFKGDLQLELINKWNSMCKTKTSFNKFQRIGIEDIIDGVNVEDLIKCPHFIITPKKLCNNSN